MNSVNVRWKAWYGDENCTLHFPQEWEVEVFGMPFRPALDLSQITNAILHPIGTKPLQALAKGLKTVAIAIDDLSRPTPVRQILSVVLDQLQQAGLKDNDISIVFALGTHPPLTKDEMIEKLGPSVFETFRIVQHDPHHNLLDIGLSLDGIPVRINQYFFDADIKILVGFITPHSFAGFSGGGKMIFPGLANFDIIERTHRSVLMGFKGGLGLVEGNQFREEIQTVCRQCGVDFSIDVVLNQDREISGIFAGHVEDAFREGVECARKSYRTTRPSLVDVAILNAYPKDPISFNPRTRLIFIVR